MLLLTEEQTEAVAQSSGVPWGPIAFVSITLLALPFLGRIVRKFVPGAETTHVNWGLREVSSVFMIVLATMLFVGNLVRGSEDVGALLIASSVSLGLPAALACVIAARRGPDGLAALGVRGGRLLQAPVVGVSLYLVLLLPLGSVQYVWVWILRSWGRTTFEQPLIDLLQSVPEGDRLLPILIGAGLQPLFEEVFFRGFLQPVCVRRLGALGGIALTSLVFAGLHGVEGLVPIFALSCLLGYVMMRTQRLHAVWAIHALHNGLQFLMLYAFPEILKRAAH